MGMDAWTALGDEEKDKVLKSLWNYADKTALADHSDGQYEITDSAVNKMKTVQDDGVVSLSVYSVFVAKVSGLHSDKDENGKDIPGKKKQDKVIQTIRDMGLSAEQSSYLYRTQYDNDKNNPWA